MADTKISALTALAGADLAADDLLVVVDTSVTTTKSMRADELLKNLRVNLAAVGTSGVGVVVVPNGTAPTSAPADAAQLYAADYAAGDSRLYVYSESGTQVILGNGTVEAKAPAAGAGNGLTLRASSAVDGNTNGGNLTLTPGLKAGSGADGTLVVTRGQVQLPNLGAVGIHFGNAAYGLGSSGDARFTSYYDNGVEAFRFWGDTFLVVSGKKLQFGNGSDIVISATTGTKIGTGTTQKLGFWDATPVAQQVLATGAGATVDDVISLLQTLGLCKQS